MSKKEVQDTKNVNENKNKNKDLLVFVLCFVLVGVITFAASYLYKLNLYLQVRNTIMTLFGTGVFYYSLVATEKLDLYYYKLNSGNYKNILFMYIGVFALSCLFPLLPETGWPFLVIFISFSLFSNAVSGTIAGSICLMISVLLNNSTGITAFSIYFITGIVGILLFSALNTDFRVGNLLFLSHLIYFTCIMAGAILPLNQKLTLSLFIYPIINIIVCLILLSVTLRYFNGHIVDKYREKYMEINDPECPLLVSYKEHSPEQYYHAMHTAYLCDKICKALGYNNAAAKSCGYYNQIAALFDDTEQSLYAVMDEYNFPPDARELLTEYVKGSDKITSKEALVVYFADCIVTSILYLFKKDPEAKLNYEQIINTIFDKKSESVVVWNNDISFSDFKKMRKLFIGENLYYDFLRR